MMNADQNNQELVSDYLDFLDDEEDEGFYHRRVKEMIDGKRVRLIVSINDLRRKKASRAASLLKNASAEIAAFQDALREYVRTLEPSYDHEEFFVGFEGSFGDRHLTPRTLSARYLNNLVCIEGIANQCSLVKPKLVSSVHYCPATKKISKRNYSDLTSITPNVTAPVYPTHDEEGNPLETEFGLSLYRDHQTLVMQEMLEKAPAGQLPRFIDVICDNDLADRCKPGDRAQIVGIYRCLPEKHQGVTSGVFRTVLIANNITLLNKDHKIGISSKDVANCRLLARKRNIFELLSRSLAPSIHGHEYVKKAILCMMLGGVEKILANGTRLRGDINILLIGDPSVAKSQLLRYVLHIAPRSVATTGRGSSGVGLTAAVTRDFETGEPRLEAGAMVIADRGIVCIDEFDKMSDIDRTAIHEVMEQGRVTINKAGIHTRLNARCCVLAAANPVYGKYDQYKPPMENIGLQDSLLSRFDLLFVMLDIVDNDVDSKISDHVLRMHRYRKPGEQDGEVLPPDSSVDFLSTKTLNEDAHYENTPVYEKYDPLLHGNSRSKSDKIFTVRFMKIYIHFARTLKPKLTDEASALIANEYARLRSQDAVETGAARTQPVTVRTLEAMIRLSTAHAKARLSTTIETRDAEAAIELVQFAYFQKVLDKEKKRGRAAAVSDLSEEEDEEVVSPTRKRRKAGDATAPASPSAGDATAATPSAGDGTPATMVDVTVSMDSAPLDDPIIVPLSQDRLEVFKRHVSTVFQQSGSMSIPRASLVSKVNEKMGMETFSETEVTSALHTMSNENALMVSDDNVILI